MKARTVRMLALTLLLAACGDSTSTHSGNPVMPDGGFAVRLEQINISLDSPVFLTVTGLPGDTRLFVVEKGGVIKILDRASGNVIATFLDISNLISTGGEQGLLGLAFDPEYATNRRFYVSYTDLSGKSVIARYLVNANNANVAVPTADLIILTVTQPFENHNGGMIAFGPDNFLYIGLGDGGGGGDPDNRAQNRNDLLGKLLRIDVSQSTQLAPYAVPSDNPFVRQAGVKEEIWSFGLRNPWRFSFDRLTNDLYIADVGEGTREEVNASIATSGAGKGINYGWRLMEGSLCFNPATNCNAAGQLTLPVIDYSHSEGCSVTGGYVYRGDAVPALRGTYFYADFCTGFVRSFRLVSGVATEKLDWTALRSGGNVTSFGEDAAGELYVITSQGGLFRIAPN